MADLYTDLRALADELKARMPAPKPMPTARVQAYADRNGARPTMAAYRAMLAAHDWHFEHSDDPSAWRAGRDSIATIRAMQRELDPMGWVFDEYARRVTS